MSWLEAVDVAFCHQPELDDAVHAHALRPEPRALVVQTTHRLAQHEEVTVADLDNETFVSYHPDVQPQWAGFHSLDDHRQGPPESLTLDHAETSLQMLGIMSTRRAVTIIPQCDAVFVAPVSRSPRDPDSRRRAGAAVARVADRQPNPLIEALVTLARTSDP